MSKPGPKLVHENEAQRRHARIKIPARLVITDTEGKAYTLPIRDLSASGFAVPVGDFPFEKGKYYTGELLFRLNSVEFRLPVNFTVVHSSTKLETVGCEFEELDHEQISILRLFISKYIAGELVTDDDILTTLSRNNFTKPRKHDDIEGLTGWKRTRAILATALAALTSLAVLCFIAYSLYQNYFITSAVTALVNVDTIPVQAPDDGYVELVTEVGKPINQDAVLATVSSPVYEFLKQSGIAAKISEELPSLQSHIAYSVVKSPCQGKIFRIKARDKAYVHKGETLFELISANSQPYITAVFKYRDAGDLAVGKAVTLTFPAEKRPFSGTIRTLNIDMDANMSNVLVTIEPDSKPDESRIGEPVFVSTAHTPSFLHFFKL